MGNKEYQNISYKISKIRTTNFSFNEKEDSLDSGVELGINLNMNLYIEDKSAKVDGFITINIDVESEFFDKESKTVYVHHNGNTSFSLFGVKTKSNKKDEVSYDFPRELLIQMYSISYTHARALLSVENNSTMFKKFFLPIIDPSIFINNIKKEVS